MPEYRNARIILNEEISSGIYKIVVEAQAGDKVKPGQFFMLKCWDAEPVLWRPISISEVDEGSVTFLCAKTGRGTEKLVSLKSGQEIQLLGPLGNGFDTEKLGGRIALVCGGIGIAPMVELSKRLSGFKPDLYAGFRNEGYAVDEIKKYAGNIYISTEDGSTGHKGYVTEIFDASDYDAVLCCGPEVMMEKVLRHCREKGKKVYVSMEKHMACGVGACLVCTCRTKDGNRRTCKDGPVFDGDELVLD
ncbi:MAG: dihydroorotate dehydrogenase electron transfer subunit [Bacillota bacterium]|nr:dihydroorotate dehydrogenase electron transfer subunit [Bacillota bacterium]